MRLRGVLDELTKIISGVEPRILSQALQKSVFDRKYSTQQRST